MKKKKESADLSENKTLNLFEVPSHGSLGLLALGAVGLKAWREKRAEEQLKTKQETKND